MKIHRFYIEKIEVSNEQIILEDKDLLNQILNVFRMDVGSKFNIFGKDEGENKEYFVEIAGKSKKEITCKVLEEKEVLKRDGNVTLAFSMIKKENMELVLQKCTEIGVFKFIPLLTERTVKTGWNNERMQKIIVEATEQSGWGEVPELVNEPVKLEKYLKENTSQNIYVLDFAGAALETIPLLFSGRLGEIIILVGPEGGFSESERQLFKKYNLNIISLGKNVLRAETACIAISSLLLL